MHRAFRFAPIAATVVLLGLAAVGYFALHRNKGAAPPMSLSIAALPFQIHDSADSLPQAEQQLNAVLKIDRDFRFAKAQLAQVYADDHQCDKALAVAPFPAVSSENAMTAYAWARCNQAAKAEQYVGTVEASAVHGRYVDAFAFATVYAALHDRAAVYRWLNKAVDDNDWALFQLRVHPAFREYRSAPEFQRLARRARMM